MSSTDSHILCTYNWRDADTYSNVFLDSKSNLHRLSQLVKCTYIKICTIYAIRILPLYYPSNGLPSSNKGELY